MMKLYSLLVIGLFSLIGNSQIVNIPDANFKAKLVNALASGTSGVASTLTPYSTSSEFWTVSGYSVVDTNHDGEIQVSEAQAIKYLYLGSSNITDMTGIESFVNLQYLSCYSNAITNIDVSHNIALKYLYLGFNELSALDISQNTSLEYLECSWNPLPNLNVSQNISLKYLGCYFCTINTIDVTNNVSLEVFKCGANNLTSVNVSQNTLLQKLDCSNSSLLTILDTSLNPALRELHCDYSYQLTSLDISQNPLLNYLNCSNNLITSLFLKNGNAMSFSTLDFSVNPSLTYICADQEDVALVQLKVNSYGISNTCQVNSYCSFTPGGTYYTLQGNTRFDTNGNGCDTNDISIPNQRFTITNGTVSGTIASNVSGSYFIPVQSGTQTITPVFENPNYFMVSPISATVNFPTATSPYTNNFCIAANGVHNDLEVSLFPIGPTNPGFDAKYKIIFKNKGTTIQNGTINLMYDESLMDLVSALPATATQSLNNLNWNFNNLQPFESREILLTLNINSPSETPAVNAGNILPYTATVSGATDESPNDNISKLYQTVVNSLDPNDKTCIEGTTVSSAMIGQYVHYVIRFENNGTANAHSIVVKDIIDITKFDITTLVPLSGSHSFVTRTINANQIEFIFENINLPFDNANNDGYVAFKIKTKPTLVVGNTFSNSASIYFDYNFPIVTNTYTTTIQVLGTQDFEFNSVFSLSPVPAKDSLTITAKQNVAVSFVSIYNMLGQLVKVITSPTETIDVSGLKTGNYFIKIITDKGTSTEKFIKE